MLDTGLPCFRGETLKRLRYDQLLKFNLRVGRVREEWGPQVFEVYSFCIYGMG